MSAPRHLFEEDVLADRIARVQRHLERVKVRLPARPEELLPESDASDAVLLHLWQAVQIVIDLAVSACVRLGLGTPPSYGDAFRRLAEHGYLEPALAERLARAAGFRNLVAHAYDTLDLGRVHAHALTGPPDLLSFLKVLRDLERR